jgi:O-methyltransferase involved in polyketide biosynthesis
VPHSARIWNYWLGGTDNYPVDRAAGDAFLQVYPAMTDVARAARAFLSRTVSHLAGEAGIRQFLDVGSGLPAADNTHEVAQRIAPSSRIVYVDNDPLVLAHARSLLASSADGACSYLDADIRDPARIVDLAARTLDLGQPVALMLIGVLGHISSDDEAASIVQSLVSALPPGSYLTLSDGTNISAARLAAHDQYRQTGAVPYKLRSPGQIEELFAGLELLEPGVVPVSEWRPAPSPSGPSPQVTTYGGMARRA